MLFFLMKKKLIYGYNFRKIWYLNILLKQFNLVANCMWEKFGIKIYYLKKTDVFVIKQNSSIELQFNGKFHIHYK